MLNVELNDSHVKKEIFGLDDSAGEFDETEAGSMMTRLHSNLQFVDVLAGNSGNRMISGDNAEDSPRALSNDDDDDVCYTYKNGKPVQDDDSAPRVDSAVYYDPGADFAEVNIVQNKQITKEKAPQKSARWRVLTTRNMLGGREVRRDLKIKVGDKTVEALAEC
jgi:hypothetical protein